jgi:zinc transporter ZupT
LHNFLGGLAIAGTFLIDTRLGITSWLAAAAHEVARKWEISVSWFMVDGQNGRCCCSTYDPA